MRRRNRSHKSTTQSVSEDLPDRSINAKIDLILQGLDDFDSRLRMLEIEPADGKIM